MAAADKPSSPAPADYVVEVGPWPVSDGLDTAIARALARGGPAPPAFVWNDIVPVFRRGFRWDYRCLRWPFGDPLLAGQVGAAGRCAIRGDLLDRLCGDGAIVRRDDTTAALAHLIREAPDAVAELEGVWRFTGAQRGAAYRPRTVPAPPGRAASLSIVVNYRDRPELMQACLASIAAQRFTASVELLLVDNRSAAANRARVEEMCRALPVAIAVRHLAYDAPFNKSVQDNMAAEAATGEILVLMNNDARVLTSDGLQALADWAMTPGVASAGPRFTGRRGRLVSAGVQTVAAEADRPAIIRESEVEALSRTIHFSAGASFACAAVRRSVWRALGGCDAAAFVSQHNDSDFDLRALARDDRHLYVGTVAAYHQPGASEGQTRAALESLRETLRRRHPDMAKWRRLDPALESLQVRPCFAAALPRATLAAARLYGGVRNAAARAQRWR